MKNQTICNGSNDEKNMNEVTEGSCRITKIPTNGFVQYLYSPGVYFQNNEIIPNFGKVQFTCSKNHRIIGNDTVLCRNGAWDSAFPVCEPFCRPIAFGITISATCTYQNDTVSCRKPRRPGTAAKLRCKYGYESVRPEQQTICGSDGRWQPEILPCSQICGELTHESAALIGGRQANIADLPWHVTIFKQATPDDPFEQICGGTIVNAMLIMTATHCFWNKEKNQFDDPKIFRIKTSKLFRQFDDGNEKAEVQTFSDIRWNQNSKHVFGNGFEYDLVTVILEKCIKFNAYTSPICIDYQRKGEDIFIPPGRSGLMGGWGINETTGKPNDMLNIIELSVIARETCRQDSAPDFLRFLTKDKFCAERLSTGLDACPKDSGGGLVVPIENNNRTKYFLMGVASIVLDNPPDRNQYLTFANHAYFLKFLHKYIDQMWTESVETYITPASKGPETNSTHCTVTDIPINGLVTFLTMSIYAELGTRILNSDVIRYECRTDYSMKGKPVNVCLNGTWSNSVPECFIDLGKHTNDAIKI